MNNYKEILLTKINCDLIDSGYDPEEVKKIANIIDKNIMDYEVTEASRELLL